MICDDCGRDYEWERGKGHTKVRCNSCHANNRRYENKRKEVAYLGGKCVRCGYNKCAGALHAHHIGPDKSFNLSGNHGRSWENLRKELDKCILLCSNCHFEEHHNCDRYGCSNLTT